MAGLPFVGEVDVDSVMDRRTFIGSAASGVLASSLGAFAQPQRKVWRIGLLVETSGPAFPPSSRNPFSTGMADLGYIEGENYVMERLYAEGHYERLPGLAAELVRRKVDLMLTLGTPATQAAQKATATIPIVMAVVADPVGSGIVRSLARPGGNITGLSNRAGDLGPKHVDLLLGVLPKLSRVGVLMNPGNASHHPKHLESIRAAAQARGFKVVSVAARPGEIESAFSEMLREDVEAVIVAPDNSFARQHNYIAAMAMKGRLPSIANYGLVPGALMSYGSNVSAL